MNTVAPLTRPDEYPDLAPLPDGFVWTWDEFFDPAEAARQIGDQHA